VMVCEVAPGGCCAFMGNANAPKINKRQAAESFKLRVTLES
jgi:hypothetical protein